MILGVCLYVNFGFSVLVAEVTQPSLGVGYEIGRAVAMGKPILCLFRPSADKRTLHSELWANHRADPKVSMAKHLKIFHSKNRIEEFLQVISFVI